MKTKEEFEIEIVNQTFEAQGLEGVKALDLDSEYEKYLNQPMGTEEDFGEATKPILIILFG